MAQETPKDKEPMEQAAEMLARIFISHIEASQKVKKLNNQSKKGRKYAD